MTVAITSNTVVPLPEKPLVREQIRNMTGHATEEDFFNSLPESTLAPSTSSPETTEGVRTKRKWTRKAKVAVPSEPIDPIVARFNADATSMGGAELIRAGIDKATKIPLTSKEDQRLSDFFYVLSKKANVNIADSWIGMGCYCVCMLFSFVLTRSEAFQKFNESFTSFFGDKKEKKENSNGETE